MRALLIAALLTIPLAAAAGVSVRSPCNAWLPAAAPVDATCPAPIHPGARSSACTLNWVVTDGTRVFIGAAKHCTYGPTELSVEGVDHAVASLVLRDANDTGWYQIHDADLTLVDGSLQQWGGPTASEPATQVAGLAAPGSTVLWFGHGVATDGTPALRGRAGPLLEWYHTANSFLFAGEVSGGDSGSPVMLASGEALGMVSATIFPAGVPCALAGVCSPVDVPVSSVVFGVSLKTEMAYLSAHFVGAPVHLVTGRALLSLG